MLLAYKVVVAEGIELRVVVPARLMLQFTWTGLDLVMRSIPVSAWRWPLLVWRWEGEAGRGDGAAWSRLHADVVGDLAGDPQAMAVLAGPGYAFAGRGRCFYAWARLGGPGLAVVGDLAVQHPVAVADDQPPVTGAVADGVGGEFMHRENNVLGAGGGRTGVGGVGGYGRPQRIQRPGIEILRQNRGDARAGNVRPGGWWRVCWGLVPGCLQWAVWIIGHGQSPG
jgi:hypothetical protein